MQENEKVQESFKLLCDSAGGLSNLATAAKNALDEESFFAAYYLFKCVATMADKISTSVESFAAYDVTGIMYDEEVVQELYEVKSDNEPPLIESVGGNYL